MWYFVLYGCFKTKSNNFINVNYIYTHDYRLIWNSIQFLQTFFTPGHTLDVSFDTKRVYYTWFLSLAPSIVLIRARFEILRVPSSVCDHFRRHRDTALCHWTPFLTASLRQSTRKRQPDPVHHCTAVLALWFPRVRKHVITRCADYDSTLRRPIHLVNIRAQ